MFNIEASRMRFEGAGLTVILFVTLLLLPSGVASAQMKVHYINVGQANAILIEFNRGAILVDAGGENTGDTLNRDHLIDYLNQFFGRRAGLNRTLN